MSIGVWLGIALTGMASLQSLQISHQIHLKYRYYPPETELARGVVIMLHGMQDHSQWYEFSGAALAANGFVVYAPDRRGSGMNQSERGDIEDYQEWLDDITAFVNLARQQHDPRLPLFLMGISWGAKQAIVLAGKYPAQVDGLILSAPTLKSHYEIGTMDTMRIYYAGLRKRTGSLPIPLNQAELYTSHPSWIEFIRQDPLVLRKATYRFFRQEKRLSGQINSALRAYSRPILLLQGGMDAVANNDGVVNMLGRATQPGQVERQLFPSASHIIEFSHQHREEYIATVVQWMARQAHR